MQTSSPCHALTQTALYTLKTCILHKITFFRNSLEQYFEICKNVAYNISNNITPIATNDIRPCQAPSQLPRAPSNTTIQAI